MEKTGWYYDSRKPEHGFFYNGTKFTEVKPLGSLGLETLYDLDTGKPIPDYDRPAAAVQHFQEWKKDELRQEALKRAHAAESSDSGTPKRKGFGCLVIIVVTVLISMIFNSCGPVDGKKSEAQYACHQFIKDRLKAPSSAKFKETTIVQQDSTFKVTSVVEAENAFGVSLLNTWTCRVLWSPAEQIFVLDLIESQ